MSGTESRDKRKGGVIAMAVMLACLLVLATAGSISAASGKDWRLVVRTVACVKGPMVLLGEIADPVDDLDARTWQSLAQVPLWQASDKPGRPVTIDRDRLDKVLRHYLGDKVSNLVLPMQFTVQTGGKVLDANQLRSQVVAFLTPRAKDLGGEVDLKELDLPDYYFFDSVTDSFVIELNGDIRPGRNQIRLRTVNGDGKVVAGKAGTVFINVWKAVPVAATPLNRGERVTRDKVGFKRVNLAYRIDLWDGTGGPWRMVRTLGRGQPFTLSHLESVPLIEKGERVNLVYRGSRIQLTVKVEALDDAVLGQQVPVLNLQSKKTVLATVVGDNTVMVR
ncbi:MAG: flagellar basal body P-ring formation chaperone FlgA [Pseudodesulfovibrio sp.]